MPAASGLISARLPFMALNSTHVSSIIFIRFGCHKCATVVQGVQIPDTTAVVFTQTVHPAEDTGLRVTHCGMRPKCCGQKLMRCSSGTGWQPVETGLFPDAVVTETEGVVELCEKVVMRLFLIKANEWKNARDWYRRESGLHFQGNGISACSPAAFLPSPTMRG